MSLRVLSGTTAIAEQMVVRQQMLLLRRHDPRLRFLLVLRERTVLSLRGRERRQWNRRGGGRELRGRTMLLYGEQEGLQVGLSRCPYPRHALLIVLLAVQGLRRFVRNMLRPARRSGMQMQPKHDRERRE